MLIRYLFDRQSFSFTYLLIDQPTSPNPRLPPVLYSPHGRTRSP